MTVRKVDILVYNVARKRGLRVLNKRGLSVLNGYFLEKKNVCLVQVPR